MKKKYQNEKIKREFFEYMKGPGGHSQTSINEIERAIIIWQNFHQEKDFSSFNKNQAIEFQAWLKNKNKQQGGGKVSLRYCYDVLRRLHKFFDWLSNQKGYKQKINKNDVEYLKLSNEEKQIALSTKNKKIPELKEVLQVIRNIKGRSEVEQRDKALLSLLLLTGARVGAVVSLSLRCFDREKLVLEQNPAYKVKTKFSKKITTALFPLAEKDILNNFLGWFDYLIDTKKFNPGDPLFPATKLANDKKHLSFRNTGQVTRKFWSDSGRVREILKKRFQEAGLEYYNPHTFRHLLVQMVAKMRLTEEEKKAFSQNLGHEDVGTTFGSYGYGQISTERQIELLRKMTSKYGKIKDITEGFPDELADKIADRFLLKINQAKK